MASDMMVALSRSTLDGHTYFAHNNNQPRGVCASIVRVPGREFTPGESVDLPHLTLAQVRHTHGVLAGRCGDPWGYLHGVNDRGVAIGCTPIFTRLENPEPGLTGPELVRLALERASTARQAIEILTDLIGRYGQGAFASCGSDHAFLVVDALEGCLLEASGKHWVLAEVGSVRAVTGLCLLRQDWDRISRGLSDLAIARRWWSDDGCKLDFASAVGKIGSDHARNMHRWGQATLSLEQQSGHLDTASMRRLLCDQSELLCPLESSVTGDSSDLVTTSSFLVRLGANPGDLPVCWCAFGTPAASVFLPLFPVADPPAAFQEENGPGSRLWRLVSRWQADSRNDSHLRALLHTGLASLQQRLDEHLHEFLLEASALHRQGQRDRLEQMAGSFMQHGVDLVEDLVVTLHLGSDGGQPVPEDYLVEAW